MKAIWTILLLIASNVFMTFAWYGHLKLQEMKISTSWPLILVILFSWGVAFLEYCAQVPANRIGYVENGGPFNLMQLKIIQEVISLTVFTILVTVMFKGQSLQWNHFAAFFCLIMAVFFVTRIIFSAGLTNFCNIYKFHITPQSERCRRLLSSEH